MSLKLMYITNNSSVALIAEKYGVDRIWIDLETKRKKERQKGKNTVKSNHTIEDVKKMKQLLSTSKLLVRINPWDEESEKEINNVINAGADIIMLPMWKSAEDVRNFINAVNGRCKTLLLLETIAAEKNIDEVLTIPGIDEIHIGLNDLHIEYGLTFMFELLANGKIEEICNKIRPSGIPYGFGGIGIIGAGLCLKPEEIILEHYRLGSTSSILSRSFCNYEKIGDLTEIERTFASGIKAMRDHEDMAKNATKAIFNQNIKDTVRDVNAVVRNMQRRNNR